jgi:hypothetical protein
MLKRLKKAPKTPSPVKSPETPYEEPKTDPFNTPPPKPDDPYSKPPPVKASSPPRKMYQWEGIPVFKTPLNISTVLDNKDLETAYEGVALQAAQDALQMHKMGSGVDFINLIRDNLEKVSSMKSRAQGANIDMLPHNRIRALVDNVNPIYYTNTKGMETALDAVVAEMNKIIGVVPQEKGVKIATTVLNEGAWQVALYSKETISQLLNTCKMMYYNKEEIDNIKYLREDGAEYVRLETSTGEKRIELNTAIKTRKIPEKEGGGEEPILKATYSMVPVFDLWWNHPKKRVYSRMQYKPTSKPLADPTVLNTYTGSDPCFSRWAVAGYTNWKLVYRILAHIRFCFCDSDEEFAHLFADEVMRASHPGTMLEKITLITGEQGSGKSLFFLAISILIHGKANYAIVHDIEDVFGKYNALAMNKVCVAVEDASNMNDPAQKARMKNVITSGQARQRAMYADTTTAENHVNILLNSNRPDVIPVEKDERRVNHYTAMYDSIQDHFWLKILCGEKNKYFATLVQTTYANKCEVLKTYYNLLYNMPLYLKKEDGTLYDMRRKFRVPIITRALVEQKIQNLDTVPKFVLWMLTHKNNNTNYVHDGTGGEYAKWQPFVLLEDLYESYRLWCDKVAQIPKQEKIKTIISSVEVFKKPLLDICPPGSNQLQKCKVTSRQGIRFFFDSDDQEEDVRRAQISINNWWESFERYMPGVIRYLKDGILDKSHVQQRKEYLDTVDFNAFLPIPRCMTDEFGTPIVDLLESYRLPLYNQDQFDAKFKMSNQGDSYSVPYVDQATVEEYDMRTTFLQTMTPDEKRMYSKWSKDGKITAENSPFMRRVSEALGLNLVFEDDFACVDEPAPTKRTVSQAENLTPEKALKVRVTVGGVPV